MRVSLKESVRQTIAYASFFDYDLTVSELHHWLISPRIVSLSRLLATNYHLPITSLSRKRLIRRKISQTKIDQAFRLTRLLSLVPTIRLVAVTGSLAMENAKSGDDIDLMIVTQEGTLWLTRLFVVPLIRLFFKTRFPVSHPRGDLQGTTLKGSRSAAGLAMKSAKGRFLKVVSLLNFLAFRLQYLYMQSKMTSESVSLNSAYFHPRSLAKSLDKHLKPHNL